MSGQSLLAFLRSGSFIQKPHSDAISATIGALAQAALEVRKLTTQGALNAGFATSRGSENTDGDIQKDLDVVADGIFLEAIRQVPVALYGSEENTGPILIDPAKPLALAIDPLDGSSNIETNVSIGTIFSILPVTGDPKTDPEESFLQPGTTQLAAGFFDLGREALAKLLEFVDVGFVVVGDVGDNRPGQIHLLGRCLADTLNRLNINLTPLAEIGQRYGASLRGCCRGCRCGGGCCFTTGGQHFLGMQFNIVDGKASVRTGAFYLGNINP